MKRTLSLRNGDDTNPEKSEIGVQVDFDSYPVAFYKNVPLPRKELVVRLKREEFNIDPQSIKKESTNDSSEASDDGTNAVKDDTYKEICRKLPWYAGCEYACKECDELFFYSEELRKHIKDKHGDPDEYLDKYDRFETKSVGMVCLLCNKNIKRHFNSILMHLRNSHEGMSMEDYKKRFKIPSRYDVVTKIRVQSSKDSIEDVKQTTSCCDSRKQGTKRKAFLEASLPRKVTRSKSDISGGDDEHGDKTLSDFYKDKRSLRLLSADHSDEESPRGECNQKLFSNSDNDADVNREHQQSEDDSKMDEQPFTATIEKEEV